jgi:AcrR family transcriptional regulator
MATSAQARRWAKTGATQERILDAAIEVFATRGFTAATVADVVAGSDVRAITDATIEWIAGLIE